MLPDVKQGADIAVKKLKELVSDAENIAFEEFEITETPSGKERLEITLSFDRLGDGLITFNDVSSKLLESISGVPQGPRRPRHFRILAIDDQHRLVSMKIRKRT